MAPAILLVGDSILSRWRDVGRWAPAGVRLINRGIAGETSTRILRRFGTELEAADPVGVVIEAGGADLRLVWGDPTRIGQGVIDRFRRNIAAMVELARRRGATVAVCTLTPVSRSTPRARIGARLRDPRVIQAVNAWLRDFARSEAIDLVDFHAALVDTQGRLATRFTTDGVHPSAEGLEAMGPVLAPVLARMAYGRG